MSEQREAKAPSWIRPLAPVLLTVLIDLLGFGIIIPLMSYYATDYHASESQVMQLAAIYSAAQFLFQPMWGALSDRIGRRPVMLVSVAGTALCLAGFAYGGSLPLLFLWRFLNGACAANISTAQACVADVTSPENRAKGMGLIGASFGLGFTFGPIIGGELSYFGHSAPIWFAAGLAAVNFVWALFALPETRKPGSAAASERSIDPRVIVKGLTHPVVGLAIAVTFAVTFAFSLMETSFGLVAQFAWKLDPQHVGRMLGLIGIVGIVIQGGLIGRLVKRFGEPPLVVVGVACNAVGMGLLALSAAGHGDALRWVGCFVIAIGTSLTNPSLSALISRGASGDEQGAILGANQSLASLARATSPFVGSGLVKFGVGTGFAVGAGLLVAALPLAFPAVRRAGGNT
jgi:DHA1 family tetracycline resistance protein-like MFS transporter